MPRDDKKITLDDILAEYEQRKDSSGGESSVSEAALPDAAGDTDMEISEEISIDENADLDDVEIVEEPFEEPALTWQTVGVEDISIVSDTYDGTESDNAAAAAEDASEQADEDAGETDAEEDETSEPDSLIEAMEDSDDVNDRWIAKVVKALFPVKGDSVGEVIRKIIFLIAVIVFIGAGIMLISTLIQSKQTLDHEKEEKNLITTTVASYIDSDGNIVTIPPTQEEIAQHNFDVAAYYKEFNSDYVGYLDLYGCDIHKPVVKGNDNDYYLHTNIFGNYNKAGTVFMDYRCSVADDYTSPNLVIYGHNQEDGTMFGNLKLYKQDVEFYKKNPVVQFSTETETWEYLIYGFFVTHIYEKQDSNGEVFHYHDFIDQLNDEATFDWYLGEIQKRNQIISSVDVQFGDQLLCLSTCSNEFTDSRFVVFARRLREGEKAEDYDLSEARLNPYAQGVDWEAIISGMTSDDPYHEEPAEVVTSEKSLNKRNVKTETTVTESEAITEETAETTVTTVPAETEETTVIPSEISVTEEAAAETSETTAAAETSATSETEESTESTASGEESSESSAEGSDTESAE